MPHNLFCLHLFCKDTVRILAVVLLSLSVFPKLSYAKDSPASHVQTSQARKLTVKAVQAMDQESTSYAKSLVLQSKDPIAYKLYDWMLFTSMKEPELDVDLFLRLTKFVRHNPEWPSISKVILLAENVMPQDLSNDEVIAWFSDYHPKTPRGMLHFMDAMIINGKVDQAKKVLSEWWSSTLTTRDQQRSIYQAYGKYLTMDAHKSRFDHLLLNENYDSARALADVIGHGYPELAEARIALAIDKGGNIEGLISRVPKALQNDAGLLYERLHWRRKHDMDEGALEILHKQPPLVKIKNPEAWWKERHIMIRRMLERRNYQEAYRLAAHHGQVEGVAYAEGQWLAGWIALRFLDKSPEAFSRFTAMFEKVETPISLSRAAYWSGRAANAMSKKKLAQEWYQKAATYKATYYGQLAMAELVQRAMQKDSVGNLSNSDKQEFAKNELVQAAQVFFIAGMDEIAGKFLQSFTAQQNSPKAYKYAAELALSYGDRNESLKIAKTAFSKGHFLAKQSYPLVSQWAKNTNKVEKALVHGIIRQESMFDTQAESSAGALGLMQLMPGTAKEVCGKLGVSYNLASLTQKPEYNILLGSSYIGRLLKKYDGNYPMAIAAYNAGPGRVSEWVEDFGDPRDPKMDLIDWIELIPISETRNYVQRVLENVYVYRLRLQG